MAKRRANGEGNIRKRSDGRWEGRYTSGRDPDTGKVIYKNVLAKTQKECKEKLKRAIEENAKVDAIRAEQYTVGRWMDVWFENCAKIKVRPSSHKTYQGYIDNHIKPSIGKIPLGKLSSLDLQKLYKRLLSGGRVERIESQKQPKGLSAKTVRNINQVISSAMDFAIDQKLIVTNPTDGCALPKLEHREMKTLPTEQLASFLHEARESGVFEMYYIELATGLRRGDYLASGMHENETDPRAAFQWMMHAADLGSDKAPYYIGMWYAGGTGIEQDLEQAAFWLAKDESPKAKMQLALVRKQLEREEEAERTLQEILDAPEGQATKVARDLAGRKLRQWRAEREKKQEQTQAQTRKSLRIAHVLNDAGEYDLAAEFLEQAAEIGRAHV